MPKLNSGFYDVGGVRLPRPFKIRRFSHFGLNVEDVERCLAFYTDLLGFMVSEELELRGRFKSKEEAARYSFTRGIFMRHGNDHHSAVLFPKFVLNALADYPRLSPASVFNQLAWQVGSIREVCDAIDWLQGSKIDLLRVGRDQPGGNWHVYSFDPDRYVNELFYGLEQIGWDRRSKPLSVYAPQTESPSLPILPEYAEVERALNRGADPGSGYRFDRMGDPVFDVDGILMPRPFKIVRTGPARLFVSDLDVSLRYYVDLLGFTVTQEVDWKGHRCVFLRVNTEHHALALYPVAARAELGIDDQNPILSIGLQMANYRQLRNAVHYLRDRGATVSILPGKLTPGTDYSALVRDPEGNRFQLYYYMAQVTATEQPDATPAAPEASIDDWPETVAARPDSFAGEVFLGPFG